MVAKHLSITELKRELAKRESRLSSLEEKRKKLQKQIDQLDAEIAYIGGGRSARRGGRPMSRPSRPASNGRKRGSRRRRAKNTVTLPDAIAQAMDKGAVVSPKEAAQLVKANGYKTTSKTFGVQVATTMAKDRRFKRVGRGQYERVK